MVRGSVMSLGPVYYVMWDGLPTVITKGTSVYDNRKRRENKLGKSLHILNGSVKLSMEHGAHCFWLIQEENKV